MGVEIERKFLVKDTNILFKTEYSYIINQCYLNDSIRIRSERNNDSHKAYIVIKSAETNLVRDEWNFEIPEKDALECCSKLIKDKLASADVVKIRHIIHEQPNNAKWEIDIFRGDNEGLILAEVELPFEDYPLNKPDWVGKEVTGDEKYYNSYLVKNPYKNWSKK